MEASKTEITFIGVSQVTWSLILCYRLCIIWVLYQKLANKMFNFFSPPYLSDEDSGKNTKLPFGLVTEIEVYNFLYTEMYVTDYILNVNS